MSRRLTVLGHEVAVEVGGDGGQHFVLIHGLGVSSYTLRPIAERLAAYGRVVLIDLPGFGASPTPRQRLGVDDLARVALAAADAAGAERAVWVGHSMGTQVVVGALTEQPDAASLGVLLAPVVNDRELRVAQVMARFAQNIPRETLRSAAASVAAVTACAPRWFWGMFPEMLRYPMAPRVADVAAPLLIMAGQRDPLAPEDWLRRLERPGDTVAVVGGGAHQIMQTHPDQVVATILGAAGIDTPTPEPARRPERRRPTEPLRRTASAAVDWAIGIRDQLDAARPGKPLAPVVTTAACPAAPVLLLPGVLETASYLRPLARFLQAQGHRVLFVPELGRNVSNLTRSADLAFAAAERAGLCGAVIVAHSKGGLIGKQMLLDPRADGRLLGMVALATPFGGSLWWDRAQRLGLVQRSPLGLFHPAGDDIARLAREDAVNARIVSIAAHHDQVVRHGTHIEGATNVTLDISGHFRPLRHPPTWRLIHRHVDALTSQQ